MLEHPRALAEVAQHERHLDERPCEVDVAAPDVAHIGVQGLGAGCRQEHGAHKRHAGGVVRAEQEPDAVHGVERLEHGPVVRQVDQADDGEEGEPHQHHRTEHLADALGAARLHGEQQHDDHHGDHQRHVGVGLEQLLQRGQRAQAFDCGADRHRRREHRVGEERRAAEHGRYGQPGAVPPDQRIQGEDAAFAVVVDAHGDQHVLDGGDQRDRPEYQREHAEHGFAVGVGEAALPGEKGLRGVQGRGADVAIHDAERHDGHAQCDLVRAGLELGPPAPDRSLRCRLGELFRFLLLRHAAFVQFVSFLFGQCSAGNLRRVRKRVGFQQSFVWLAGHSVPPSAGSLPARAHSHRRSPPGFDGLFHNSSGQYKHVYHFLPTFHVHAVHAHGQYPTECLYASRIPPMHAAMAGEGPAGAP